MLRLIILLKLVASPQKIVTNIFIFQTQFFGFKTISTSTLKSTYKNTVNQCKMNLPLILFIYYDCISFYLLCKRRGGVFEYLKTSMSLLYYTF